MISKHWEWSIVGAILAASVPSSPLTAQALGGPDWVVESNQAFANLGSGVASAGDVNGDGYDDVIVGAAGFDNGQADEGRVFVYHGSAAGLSTSAAWAVESNQASAGFSEVARAGDVNGDGYDDVIVGAPYFDNGHSEEGRASVYLGSAGGLATSPAWTAEGNQTFVLFGTWVSGAGDVNGDGYDDVIAGARYYSNDQFAEGHAFVYYGSASGPATTPSWTAEGNQDSAYFGNCVSSAGDVNGDGYDDVIVGAFVHDNGQTNEGRAYVYHGSASGLAASPAWTAESDQPDATFGSNVACAGDVNGDGYDDVIIAAEAYDGGQVDEGRVYVYLGSASGLATSAAWTAEGDQVGARFGNTISTAADWNGDGYDDVIVGAQSFDTDLSDAGRAFVYWGSATGLASTAGWTASSPQTGAQFGARVAAAGDVNGDGDPDVIIGAVTYSNPQSGEGRAFAYHGGSIPTVVTVSPDHGLRTGVTGVVISGLNFTGATQVLFGSSSVSFTVDSDTQITADLAATDTTGWVDVTVTIPNRKGTLASGFDYFEPPQSYWGSCSTPRLTWSGYPTLGQNYTVTTQNLGPSNQILLVDWSPRADTQRAGSAVGGPGSIGHWGITACTLLARPDSRIALGNTPSYTFAIPNDMGLVGRYLITQAMVLTLPVVTTQDLSARIGE